MVRNDRARLMNRIRDDVNREAARFGMTVVDVRLRRVDLPAANSAAVFQRMQTERQREAAEARALGAQQAQEIRARADRDSTVIVAEAQRRSDEIRGQGEGERNRVFAEAFGQDEEFFTFYRSMQAYEASIKAGDTRQWCCRRIRRSSGSSMNGPGATPATDVEWQTSADHALPAPARPMTGWPGAA